MFSLLQILALFAFCLCLVVNFPPDTDDYDAYGLNMAANNLMIVQIENSIPAFFITFGPYTDDADNSVDRTCFIPLESEPYYFYTVALGKNQSTYNFFFVGEVTGLDESTAESSRTFVGMYTYTGSFTSIDCDHFNRTMQFVTDAFDHQEHLVMAVDPFGLVAYGFSNFFTFSYTASTNNLTVHINNSLSPSRSFLPYAVDYDGHRGIIAGFLQNNRTERM